MIYYDINCILLRLFHGIVFRLQIYHKMSFFVLLIFSYLCSVFVESIESDTSNVTRLIELSKCGLSNKNFIFALHLNELCSQPLLQPDEYRNKQYYDSTPLLCTEYYIVNNYICNLTKSGKSVSLPADKEGVDKLLNNFRSKFRNVDAFCNFTQKETPTFSNSQNEVHKIFKDSMVNKTRCKGLCWSRIDDGITDLCSIIIWAWSHITEVIAPITEGNINTSPDESHIEKIGPKDDVQENDKKDDEKAKFLQLNTLNTIDDHETILSETNQKISDETVRGDKVLEQQNSIKNIDAQSQEIVGKGVVVNKVAVNKSGLKIPLNKLGDTELKEPGNEGGKDLPDSKEPDNHEKQDENKGNINDAITKENVNGSEHINSNDDNNFDVPNVEVEFNEKPDGRDTPSVGPGNELDTISIPKPETDEQQEDILMQNENLPQTQGESNIGDLHRYERLGASEDTHFFTYFLSMGVVCGVMYILFHNKKKILALAVEGRRGRPHGGGRRRPNTAAYSKLDSNLEEAMVSNVSQASVTHVLY